MISDKVKVYNTKGLHLKPAGFLCRLALEYESVITLKIREKEVNAKSVLGVLSACIKYNDEVTVLCDGEDEQEALREITKAFRNGLGESVENHMK